MKSFFIVTTNGQAASKWLAQSLHLHEAICCSHGTLRLPECFTYEREYNDAEIAMAFIDEKRREKPLKTLFQELENWEPTAHVYGNVHMFNLRHLHHNLKTTGGIPSGNFVVMDLVRHPVNLIRSSAANMLQQSTFNTKRIEYLKSVYKLNEPLYQKFEKRFKLNLNDNSVLAFMAAVMTLFSLDINLKLEIPNGKRVLMELLTSDRNYFKDFVTTISNKEMDVSDSYLDKVFSQQKANAHVASNVNTSEHIFGQWDAWQKELFREVILQTNVIDEYESLGYSFAFMKS